MGLVGADVAQLRDLAGVMRRNADILERDIVGVIVASLRVSPWAGTDAEHFKQIWTFQSARQIWSAAMRLREAADLLDRNADEQDETSASDGTGGRGRIPAADGGRGLGKKTAVNREGFTEPRGGGFGRDRDMMDLAFACYDHTVGEGHDALIPGGWSEVSSDELRRLGIDPSRLGRVGQSFSSTLYRDVDGKYVLAFAGSDDPGDWKNNFVGVLSASDEVKEAAELGVYLKNELAAAGVGSSGLSFTGHSLGGALASAASVATGYEATTFNAAGLSRAGFNHANRVRLDSTGPMVSWDDASKRVTAYTATVDPLTVAQRGLNLPQSFGTNVALESKSASVGDYVFNGVAPQVIHDHMKVPLERAFDSMVVEKGEYYH